MKTFICGSIQIRTHGKDCVGCIVCGGNGRNIFSFDQKLVTEKKSMNLKWLQGFRFVNECYVRLLNFMLEW